MSAPVKEGKDEVSIAVDKPASFRAAGSGAAALRWLTKGRRVRSKMSGWLGVIEHRDVLECTEQSKNDESALTDCRPYKVTLSNGSTYWYSWDQLEPWSRGVFVCSKLSGKRGEIVRVDQRVPPSIRPYLVRLEDGCEFWYSLADVHFEGFGRRGSTKALDVTLHEFERCPLTLVPGSWRLQRPGYEDVVVNLSGTPEGILSGCGEDGDGGFKLTGSDADGSTDLKIDYVDASRVDGIDPVLDVSTLAGSWVILDASTETKWVAVEKSGDAFIAGAQAGVFSIEGRHFTYLRCGAGQTLRVVPCSDKRLYWDDGSIWRRLVTSKKEAAGNEMVLGELHRSIIDFDHVKKSVWKSDDENAKDKNGKCVIDHLEPVEGGVLRVDFKVSAQGQLPDALKSQIRVDRRIVEATSGKFSCEVVKKQKMSKIEGTLDFGDVALRHGSKVEFRYGGEYGGYTWVELVAATKQIEELSAGLYFPENKLRRQHLPGRVAGDGLSVEGLMGEGPVVTVSEKTAKNIKVERCGRTTTVSLKPYDNEDLAKIEVCGPAVIEFQFFQTEAVYDLMEICGEEYSGEELPPPHWVPEGHRLVMTWTTDLSTTDEGWEFTVNSGVTCVRFEDRDACFGAREAPWNKDDVASHFAAPLVHVADNARGLEDFFEEKVKDKVVVISAELDKGEQDESEEGLSDADLFNGPLLERVRRAAQAKARAVIFIACDEGPHTAKKISIEPSDAEKEAPASPGIPAVLVGAEFGKEIIRQLRHGGSLRAGPPTRRFRMELESPAELDGMRDLVQICLSSNNALRAIVGAEIGRLPQLGGPGDVAGGPSHSSAGPKLGVLRPLRGAPELTALVARLHSRMGSMGITSSAKDFVEHFLQAHTSDDMEIAGEKLESCVRELLRRLLPVKLPSQALLPPAEDAERSPVWEHYSKGRVLGKGAFGTVLQSWDRFAGGDVAVKKIKLRDKETLEKERLEFELVRDLSHPNLVRVLDLYSVESDSKLFIVTEYAGAGDLTWYIKSKEKIDEHWTRWIAGVIRQVLYGCRFLHGRNIIHHDVKPANVLVTTQYLPSPESFVPLVLLCDFGLARVENFVALEAAKAAASGNGTKCYMGPEAQKGLSGPKTDVYATGITMFELLSGGDCPESIEDEDHEPERDEDMKMLSHCSEAAVAIVKGLIEPEVAKRLSCADALAMHWFYPSSHCSGDGAAGPGTFPDGEEAKLRRVAAERLCSNARTEYLRRVAINLLVGQLGRTELEEAQHLFTVLDAKHDGILTEDELGIVIEDSVIMRQALRAADIHGRGHLEFREFAGAILDLSKLPGDAFRGNVEKLFAQLSSASGSVNFQTLLRRFACSDIRDVENLEDQFLTHDTHGDGHLTKEEFFKLWGLQVDSDWVAPVPPPPTKQQIRILRGKKSGIAVHGLRVESDAYSTFGQPHLGRAKGRWYYELEIIKFDSPQVGWVDQDFEFEDGDAEDGVGDDAAGWGVDGERKLKWHGVQGEEKYDVTWPRPLVLGCAADLNHPPHLRFAVDGVWDEEPAFEDFTFVGKMYPACSGIELGTFRFAPSDCQFAPPDSSYLHLVADGEIIPCDEEIADSVNDAD